MTHAYSELYLNDARNSLSVMYDYTVNDCGYDIDKFTDVFIGSIYSKRFERGDGYVISGMSGVELSRRILSELYGKDFDIPPSKTMHKSPEYWMGWALSYYQWYSGYRFKDIFLRIKASDITSMYNTYHEMDILHFVDRMNDIMETDLNETKLKTIREANCISQRELADLSGVSLRSIQMYEQRNNDIDKAQGHTLYKLSVVLGCSIEDLLERPMW